MNRTIRQARKELQVSHQLYFHSLEKWERNPTPANATAVHRAIGAWETAYDTYRRTRRNADWTRARRLIRLAAAHRTVPQHKRFVDDGYTILRE